MIKRKLLILIASVGILFGMVFWFLYIQPSSPLKALEREYTGKEDKIVRYTGLIKQIDLNANKSLLLYYNANGNVNCAVKLYKN